MPEDENNNPDGRKPPDSLHFERSEVICQGCHRKFKHVIIEEIDDYKQLRCGDVLISDTVLTCLHCGWKLFWKHPEKALIKMNDHYALLIKAMGAYIPE